MTRQVTLQAGIPQEFYGVGDFFRILDADAPLTVKFYDAGREVSEAVDVSEGYAEKLEAGTFDRVRLLSSTTQAVQFVTRFGSVVNYDAAPTGSVVVANVRGAVTQAAATVTNASGLLMAQNLTRRFLLIQNKSASGSVWLNMAGAAATPANGIKLGAGESLSLESWVPTGAIYAIGDLASNPDLAVVEG